MTVFSFTLKLEHNIMSSNNGGQTMYHAQPFLFPIYSIYALIDPRDNSVHYIGMSKQPEYRLSQHFYRKFGGAYDWLQELLQQGLQPLLSILETTENEQYAFTRERYWIDFYTERHAPLANKSPYHMRKQLKRPKHSLGY